METVIVKTFSDPEMGITAFVFESSFGGYGVSIRDDDAGEFLPGSRHNMTIDQAMQYARICIGLEFDTKPLYVSI